MSVELRRVGQWRLALVVAIGVSAAALAAWLLLRLPDAHLLLAAVAGVAAVLAAASLWRSRPHRLRWDGQQWQLDEVAGRLTLAIDLGRWMLLRFDADQAPPWQARTWLPAQRRGLEHDWHALRCAVYSPRPAPGGLATDAAPASE